MTLDPGGSAKAAAHAKNEVLVTGDFVLDHHIYAGERHDFGDQTSPGARMVRQLGGAALVHQILQRAFASPGLDWSSRLALQEADEEACEEALAQSGSSSQFAYAHWRPMPARKGTGRYWRVGEAIGFGRCEGSVEAQQWRALPLKTCLRGAKIVLLADGGQGFRNDRELWTHTTLDGVDWVVLKTSAPLLRGPLWDEFSQRHCDRLVVILSADDLRQLDVYIPARLSWDGTIGSLIRESRHGRPLHPFTRCRHLFVSFSSDGGLWIDWTRRRVNVVYEAGSIEGEHAHAVKGEVFGSQSCLAAAVVCELAIGSETPDLAGALERGLAGMRDLCEVGHGNAQATPSGFPAKRLWTVMAGVNQMRSRAEFDIDDPAIPLQSWSIFRETLHRHDSELELARLVALHGPIALASRPHLSIGKLLSVDPREIEALRTLVQVIRRYRDRIEAKRPLSIGVFGSPGSGKSFAVQEIAKSIDGEISWLEFNLSQFESPDDLIGAFHQIRDQVLQGRLPVAFFDEFDSQGHRWLQHLLAPMQDGRFQDGQLTHSIGKCVFVCAGGTSWSFRTFGPSNEPTEKSHNSSNASKMSRAFRLAKGPDFHSRLDAYLDVSGPNRRFISPVPPGSKVDTWNEGHPFAADAGDVQVSIRRALMIRHELGLSPDDVAGFDEALLTALLGVRSFRHGSRSLGKLLQPFLAAGKGPYRRSRLPAQHQIDMHTDAVEFLALMESALPRPEPPRPLDAAALEQIAEATHETWRELGRRGGWLDPKKDVPFGELESFLQRSNREAAGRMGRVLHLVGLTLKRKQDTDEIGYETGDDARLHLEYHLELLAKAEHEGWMDWHLREGWSYAETRDDKRKRHDCLKVYSRLEDNQKDRDRNAIRHYPDFAKRAGYRIVFAE